MQTLIDIMTSRPSTLVNIIAASIALIIVIIIEEQRRAGAAIRRGTREGKTESGREIEVRPRNGKEMSRALGRGWEHRQGGGHGEEEKGREGDSERGMSATVYSEQ